MGDELSDVHGVSIVCSRFVLILGGVALECHVITYHGVTGGGVERARVGVRCRCANSFWKNFKNNLLGSPYRRSRHSLATYLPGDTRTRLLGPSAGKIGLDKK